MNRCYEYDSCYLIDHREILSKHYKNVEGNENENFTICSKLFSIDSKENKTTSNRKRTLKSDHVLEEASKIKHNFERFHTVLPEKLREEIHETYNLLPSKEVRELARKLFETNSFDFKGLNGGNNSDKPLKCEIKDEYFLIPPKSRFFCGCVKEQCSKLEGNTYDLIVADPPWWNKYIRRLKGANETLSYSMMYNEEIAAIPIKNLVSNKCVVAVWCTNSQSNIDALKDVIFPSWGVEYVTTWYWLKVTINLDPLCAFSAGSKKQPYERILIGKVGDVQNIPEERLIVSVPSALHSHKPPLTDLLSPLLNIEEPQCLELFARYLLPNTTSIGYEVLKWQHISLYENVT